MSEVPSTVDGAEEAVADSAALPEVRTGDFGIAFTLEAQTALSASVPVSLPFGLEWAELASAGNYVDKGASVGSSQLAPDIVAALESSSNSGDEARLARLKDIVGPVGAPIDGILSVEDGSVKVLDDGIDASTALTGMQALRLSSLPITGEVTLETTLGQRTIDCEALWLTEPDDLTPDAGYSLHCRIPEYLETSAFIRASMQVKSEVIADATLVPNVAVGVSDSGYFVCVLEEPGTPSLTSIEIGPSDGVIRVVTSELASGASLSIPIGSECVG